jgi:ABC-type multidrug transport system permease subunit
MPPHKIVFQIVGLVCMILAMLGGFMYPLNTMDPLWIIIYEVTIFFGVSGILLLIQREGYEVEEVSEE